MYIEPWEELREYGLTASLFENPEEFWRQYELALEKWKRHQQLEAIETSGLEQDVGHGEAILCQPDCYSLEFTPFDADGYVREHCSSYIYGTVSDKDIATIESDPTLSYEQCEEAKDRLDYLAAMYY